MEGRGKSSSSHKWKVQTTHTTPEKDKKKWDGTVVDKTKRAALRRGNDVGRKKS